MADPARPQAPLQRPARPEIIGVGFLLSQLGAHSAMAYARVVQPLGLTPPHVGVLRAISEQPGRSQQAIAEEFGVPPSRMVAFIDDLEARGLVQRGRDERDRRVHLLSLSDAGEAMVVELAGLAQAVERDLLAALTPAERRQLAQWLTRVADQQGLTRGVHPGYGRLRPDRDQAPCSPG
jgi:DNA-binding MarR family transcriptional regulator